MLKELQEKGATLYVWTARGRSSTIEILSSLAIIDCFEALSCGGEGESKPSSDGLELLGIDAAKSEIVVIGDSLNDIRGAINFGVAGLAALWPAADPSSIEFMAQQGATKSFTSVNECCEYLKK